MNDVDYVMRWENQHRKKREPSGVAVATGLCIAFAVLVAGYFVALILLS